MAATLLSTAFVSHLAVLSQDFTCYIWPHNTARVSLKLDDSRTPGILNSISGIAGRNRAYLGLSIVVATLLLARYAVASASNFSLPPVPDFRALRPCSFWCSMQRLKPSTSTSSFASSAISWTAMGERFSAILTATPNLLFHILCLGLTQT